MEKPTFVMLVGLPGSGKSTLAKDIKDMYHGTIFSSDSIREELTGSEECMDQDREVFQTLHRRIKEYLAEHQGTDGCAIYDACNISYKKRMAFLHELKRLIAEKFAILYGLHIKCVLNRIRRETELYLNMRLHECTKTFTYHSIMKVGTLLFLI